MSTIKVSNLQNASAASPAITLAADGSATFAAFSNVPLLTGGGIKFPATQVASADANTLDDYEEGTWTPVIADASTGGNAGTATVDQSSYTRIGNIVTIQMYIYNLNTTGMTGANRLYIRGFPFVAAKRSSGAFYTYRVTRDAGTVSSSSMIANGSSSIYFHLFTTNGATGDRFILVSDIVGAPTEIMFTNTYQV